MAVTVTLFSLIWNCPYSRKRGQIFMHADSFRLKGPRGVVTVIRVGRCRLPINHEVDVGTLLSYCGDLEISRLVSLRGPALPNY
jgi:hypothetical protein